MQEGLARKEPGYADCKRTRSPAIRRGEKHACKRCFLVLFSVEEPGVLTRKEMSWMQTHPALRCAGSPFDG